MSKLTVWYPPEIKPARVGWYDLFSGGNEVYYFVMRCFWDGQIWRYLGREVRGRHKWRGLANDPEAT